MSDYPSTENEHGVAVHGETCPACGKRVALWRHVAMIHVSTIHYEDEALLVGDKEDEFLEQMLDAYLKCDHCGQEYLATVEHGVVSTNWIPRT